MRIRFYNAIIITMEEGKAPFLGEIHVEDERIKFIGNKNIMKEWAIGNWGFEKEIDCKGNVLMPGFKDAHTHSGMTFLRSYIDDVPLNVWLNDYIFPAEAQLTADDIYYLTKLAILEYLTSGITAIFDMYLTPMSIAKACTDLGMRCVQVSAINNFSQTVEMLEESYNKLNDYNSLNSYMLGFHAEYTCSKELIKKIVDLAEKYKAPVYTHLAETRSEVNDCILRYGMTPAEFLHSMGVFKYGGGAFHCVHMSDNDIELFSKSGLSIVTNPASNMKLASGVAPIEKFLKANINIAIGTDGAASNNCLDMFREMFLIAGLSKLYKNDAAAIDAADVLKMATVNGAKAMNLKECDILAVGKYADIIMIDMSQPNMQPIINIPKNIVYSGSKHNVKMTMIAGKILYMDGEFFIGESKEKIYEEVNKIKSRILKF